MEDAVHSLFVLLDVPPHRLFEPLSHKAWAGDFLSSNIHIYKDRPFSKSICDGLRNVGAFGPTVQENGGTNLKHQRKDTSAETGK
jgi:hypothetical protein